MSLWDEYQAWRLGHQPWVGDALLSLASLREPGLGVLRAHLWAGSRDLVRLRDSSSSGEGDAGALRACVGARLALLACLSSLSGPALPDVGADPSCGVPWS